MASGMTKKSGKKVSKKATKRTSKKAPKSKGQNREKFEPKKRGRKPKAFDAESVKRLAASFLSLEDIAFLLNCDVKTLRNFSREIRLGRAERKHAVLQVAFSEALGYPTKGKDGKVRQEKTVNTKVLLRLLGNIAGMAEKHDITATEYNFTDEDETVEWFQRLPDTVKDRLLDAALAAEEGEGAE